jgi:hypothetical protein
MINVSVFLNPFGGAFSPNLICKIKGFSIIFIAYGAFLVGLYGFHNQLCNNNCSTP